MKTPQNQKYTLISKDEVAELATKFKEEFDRESARLIKKGKVKKRGKMVYEAPKEGYLMRTVRAICPHLSNRGNSDKEVRAAKSFIERCLKREQKTDP